MRGIIAMALAAALSCICASAQCAQIDITTNSRIAVDTSKPVELKAAQDLGDYIERITGRSVPVESDSISDDGRFTIAVGDNSLTQSLTEKTRKIDQEGFIIKSSAGQLLIRGSDSRATGFGVNYFLRKYCGVRWYMPIPGSLGTVVPRKSGIFIGEFADIREPDFVVRAWGGGVMPQEVHDEWDFRNLGQGRRYLIHHNMNRIMHPSQYYKDHPEYYALVEGKRDDTDDWWQPCTSNPDVIEFFSDYAIKYFDANPKAKVVPMGLNDGKAYCECANCIASGKTASDRIYAFYGKIVKRTREKYPDKSVGVLVYASAETLPEGVTRLEGIVGALPWDRTNWFNDKIREEDQKLTRKWASTIDKVYFWNWFHGQWYVMPTHYPHTIDKVVKFARELGNCDGMYSETYTNASLDGPKLWVLSSLLWDGGQSVDALLNDYCQGMFGKGGRWMRRYYDLLEAVWDRQNLRFDKDLINRWRGNVAQVGIYSSRDLVRLRNYLDRAARSADTSDDKARVEMMAQAFHQFDLTWRLYGSASKAYSLGSIDGEAKAAKAEKLVSEIMESQSRLTKYQADVISKHDYLTTAKGQVSISWLLNEISDYRRKAGSADASASFLSNLSDSYQDSEEGKLAAGLAGLGAGTLGQNLVTNPRLQGSGFEVNGLSRVDWTHDDLCPAGWYRWRVENRKCFFTWKDAAGGLFSGIKGPCTNEYYIHVLPVKPGQRLFVSTLVKPRILSGSARAALEIQYWNEEKWWTEKDSVSYNLGKGPAADRWYKLAGVVRVPDDARYMVVSLAALGFAETDSVLFDDVRVQGMTDVTEATNAPTYPTTPPPASR